MLVRVKSESKATVVEFHFSFKISSIIHRIRFSILSPITPFYKNV